MKISAPRGTYDILPEQTARWHRLEGELRRAAALYGYGEIRFPMFEHTELFLRGMGETGDVVQKEMYTFHDKDNRSLTLRPEGTASVVRAFIEHGLHMTALPFKCYYIAPNFRYEKPQKGRYRQHVQFGAECFGAAGAQADAEVIMLAHSILSRLGLTNVTLHLNTIGCKECRPTYQKALFSWLDERRDSLCETCRERLDRNPMRVLDCKVETCAAIAGEAPKISGSLCPDCASFAKTLEALLTSAGVPFVNDPRIVRGFDYYTKTVFEFISNDIGSQGAVCAGGRYDGLVGELGGVPTPALGFGMGLERILLAMEANGGIDNSGLSCDLYLAPLDADAGPLCMTLCRELRDNGVAAETDLCGRGLKAQMKYADKRGAKYTMVIGGDEMQNAEANLKNMRTGEAKPCLLNAKAIVEQLSCFDETR